MANRAPANKGLGNLAHFNRRDHPRVRPFFLQRVLQGQGVDDGGQHAHVVGDNAVNPHRRCRHAADEIAAAHHNGDLHAHLPDFRYFLGNPRSHFRINAKSLLAHQGFATQLQQDAFKCRLAHMVSDRDSSRGLYFPNCIAPTLAGRCWPTARSSNHPHLH